MTKTGRIRIGVLASGSGSNLQSIIDHIEAGLLTATIALVVSNIPDALALERARKHGIPALAVDHREFLDREAYDAKLVEILQTHGVQLVVMAGFMRILTPVFLRAFPMSIMNIHPAILPSFPGMHAQEKAYAYGVKFSGCTVHFADEGVDTGPIIIQGVVPVYDDDTAESLTARILAEEHRIYPQAIQLYAEGRLVVEGRKVRIRNGERIPLPAMHNPPLSGF